MNKIVFFIVHVQSVFLCSSTAAIDVLFTVRFCFSFNKAPSLWICLLFSQIHFSRLLKPVSLNFSQIIIRESYRKFILKHVVKDSTVLPFFFKIMIHVFGVSFSVCLLSTPPACGPSIWPTADQIPTTLQRNRKTLHSSGLQHWRPSNHSSSQSAVISHSWSTFQSFICFLPPSRLT